MNACINNITGRLSLRHPQRESLEILARVADIMPLKKDRDVTQALQTIQAEFPTVTDFEREFPSLCFALATGVGKTRLMGAFISYLHLAKGIQHFFVLAPNLTIYNKLIADFKPNTPKYVFQGIAEFATNPPELITGDDYESGRGVRKSKQLFENIHINIFNISKINTEVRGGNSPRIKRLPEYIGQSYFDYLAGLDDLVLLMDESHRYRASAGVRAINELKPIIGLELTATPQIETGGQAVPFKNVIYSYPLHQAMEDGFVKEPAVATRENFNAANYNEEQLERLKLEDGIRVHENTKVELEVYAKQNDVAVVKPFMLVVAQDTDHANKLVALIKQDNFFEGRYKDKVITVHSNLRGDEADETVERLLAVEKATEPTEIVVHVNMLKEGWDVTNLYTIVPLRAANSKTLVEQSIGRGLRLPYGRRVGVSTVDRLTIVAHDRFQEIIDEANRPDSIIRKGVIIGRDIPVDRKETVVVEPVLVTAVNAKSETGAAQGTIAFPNPAHQEIAKTTLEVIKRYENLPRSADLQSPEMQARMVREVSEAIAPKQAELAGVTEKPDVASVVKKTTEMFVARSIDIPRIIVTPTGEVTSGFNDFDLDVSGINQEPVEKEILIQHLRTSQRERLVSGDGIVEESRPENYLVGVLVDYNDISYDDHADLLYKLAGQAVAHLRSVLKSEDAVLNVLQYHQHRLGEIIHNQMMMTGHHWERAAGLKANVSRGFTSLRPNTFSATAGEKVRDCRTPVDEKLYIRGMVFGGFKRCLYPVQKFQSDPERRFAVLLEDDKDANLKWIKPASGQVRIDYRDDQSYEPDFVVETSTEKMLCEVKSKDEMNDDDVQSKAKAGATYCKHASDHAKQNGGKPWRYLLIPHDAVDASKTLSGLASTYTYTVKAD